MNQPMERSAERGFCHHLPYQNAIFHGQCRPEVIAQNKSPRYLRKMVGLCWFMLVYVGLPSSKLLVTIVFKISLG